MDDGNRTKGVVAAKTPPAGETDATAAELLRLKRELAITSRIAEIFLHVPDEEMYAEVLRVILDALNSEYGVFGYIDESGDLVVPSMRGDTWDKCNVADKAIVYPRQTWGNSTWARAIAEKRTIYSNQRSTLTPQGHIPISRHIAMPILYEGEVIGLFQVANKETDYDENDIRNLQTIAERVVPNLHARLQGDRFQEQARQAQQALIEQQRNETTQVKAELERVREELVRKTRLAAIGQVSASIAHDVRNPLASVRNAAFYLKRKVPQDEPELAEFLQIIEDEVDAANRIITGLLDLTGSTRPVNKQTVDLRELVEDAFSRITDTDGVRCRISTVPDPFQVQTDPDQFRQVLVNLGKNAVQAMEGKGEIVVEASRSPSCDVIVVRDTGPGIPGEVRKSLFEPLVTTKAMGTGLGLAICRQIVDRHGGTIELMGNERPGAAFQISLPREGQSIDAE